MAREAGRQLREAFAGPRVNVQAKSSPTDLVSEADHAAERLIRERLSSARPGDGFLGEEGGDEQGTTGIRWVVDPLDGTINFLFGIPQWAVSIACEDADGTLAGVIYDPMRDELWSALRDGPPLLDGREIHASTRDDLATAMVATGFGYDAEVRRVQAEAAARLLPRVRDIRRFGSAALDLAWTAAGPLRRLLRARAQPLGPGGRRAAVRARRAGRPRARAVAARGRRRARRPARADRRARLIGPLNG